ncbi:dnaJ homolog subfamily C member 1 [Frankliniella occidentalis]|uniref:DnaJ homolog subfamily C member 1 n=1 Tax=Frankliniella occidentalis TaxID=133901 RepID=A0A6J1SUQ4_FRAOC|nr:dnaJ homolog subfamily C member 1 [Frankliniella occidentalis]
MRSVTYLFLILAGCCVLASAWSNDEYELFDLVEEVNKNFYELLEIPKDAGATEIRKAFRKLSLVLHPDKNSAPDADVKFRQLVAVYDVIKDPNKRKLYDDVLVNGLPDWKSAVYYYRRVRKMGLAEMSVILFVILTVGQYLVGWGSYLEKKFIAQEFISSKMRKQQKKAVKKSKGDAPVVEEVLSEIPIPSVKDTLPFQIPRFLWWLVAKLPFIIVEQLQERKRFQEELRLMEEEERAAAEAAAAEKAGRGPRKRKGGGFSAPEITGDDSSVLTQAQILAKAKKEMKSQMKKPAQSGGLWTDEDIDKLIKLVKKFPAGSLERWEKIADAMERSVHEVTHMAQRVKEGLYKTPNAEREGEGEVQHLLKIKKVKTRGGKLGDCEPTEAEADYESKMESSWNQIQQKALEAALIKYPKGSTQDRWEKIAKCVPDKTKEECMIRFKYLVDLVKKKKEKENAQTVEETVNTEDSEKTEETEALDNEPCLSDASS